jgi:small-conductance mechanosensitive channel
MRPTRRMDAAAYQASAQAQLRRFRKGSALAVALTAILLLVWGAPVEEAAAQPDAPADTSIQETVAVPDPSAAVDEATTTIRDLAYGFYAFLPRLLLGVGIFIVAALLTKLLKWLLQRTLGGWQRTTAVTALVRLVIFLVAAVATLSIVTGDVRAVVGSVGLLGLAASWALQTPIESFTGWLLNSFRGYYRVGDRIAVGDVFGDVYRIDVLTTTVWEAGGPGKPVAAAQSTGALITFPNWEVLRSNIVNYSRDFPFVWDEITVNVANESDLGYCVDVLRDVTRRVLGDRMEEAAQQYEALLRAERLAIDVDEVPHVYLSSADSWTECTIRYLVPVRTRRTWSSTLLLAVSRELANAAHRERIISVYPRIEAVVRPHWSAGNPPAGAEAPAGTKGAVSGSESSDAGPP